MTASKRSSQIVRDATHGFDSMSDTTAIKSEKLEEVRQKLANFIDGHPYSAVVSDEEAVDRWLVERPWGDDTLEIVINEKDVELIDTLNAIFLPERYSAIYHRDEKALEVAYTVFLPTGGAEIASRKFSFVHRQNSYSCDFAPSSDRLLHLAQHSRPVSGLGSSNHRNLMGYANYMMFRDEAAPGPDELKAAYKQASPISFWIRDLEWDDDTVADLVHHLNFYMNYYDRETPIILIHTPADQSRAHNPQKRFPFDAFPPVIRANDVDRTLLHFWTASLNGDPARRFLYNYQILDYSAHYVIDQDVKSQIAKLLATPHAQAQIDDFTTRLIDTVANTKIHDTQKVDQLLKRCVDPGVVWRILVENTEFFAQPVRFEGGHTTSQLIQKDWKERDFCTSWPTPFSREIRQLRNALSHGRESSMSTVVMPTAHNMRLLQPWVPAIAAAAQEVMTYRHLA